MATSTDYYDETCSSYDSLHANEPEHTRALELGWPLLGDVKSVLDVGCGTGRSLRWIGHHSPDTQLLGLEPSAGMISQALLHLPHATIKQGQGEAIPYADGSLDVAIATGIMHHVDNPSRVISEMFRVSRKGILISDHNNYAFGGPITKRVRMGFKMCGLLGVFTYVKQGFNRKGYTEEDGWWYPYSLFDNYAEIARMAAQIYIIPTGPATGKLNNLIFSQSHFCIIATKD